MTEGHGTGFPKIDNALRANKSPHVKYVTDKDRHSFLAIIKVQKELLFRPDHVPSKLGDRLGEKLGEKVGENEARILIKININTSITIAKLSDEIGISTTTS